MNTGTCIVEVPMKTGFFSRIGLQVVLFVTVPSSAVPSPIEFGNESASIRIVNQLNVLWEYKVSKTGKVFELSSPLFEINGKPVAARFVAPHLVSPPEKLRNGVTEYVVEGGLQEETGLRLRIRFRIPRENRVVRFRYELSGEGGQALTRNAGQDHLIYLTTSLNGFEQIKEVQFSEFNEMVHSFCLSARALDARHFQNSQQVMGPMVTGAGSGHALVVAYEHGSQVPDAFLEYKLAPDKTLTLAAVKGNYYHRQSLSPDQPFQTVWLEFGALAGTEENLTREYRSFVLRDMSQNLESRKPYIFYNTWNFQERNYHWNHRRYLDDMTEERMLEEIEVAHRMGVEVFVIDTGWYEKAGDWPVGMKRFPNGLRKVKERLDSYGMKLGLWFNPTAAAISSEMLKHYRDCIKTLNGKADDPAQIWETEASYSMCLASRYREAFADKLIALHKELGVTYFKWDAIDQYGCNDLHHWHGTEQNSPKEREDSFAFEVGRSMSWIADRLGEACPDAIVDFDITEGHRAVGLGFLASGKYFLINNGPYFFNYNLPFDKNKDNWNLFFYPGPARDWICRTPLTYDKWFPTVLFLTHYLPDDPYENQSLSLGSLILGQNGIWGDLPKISREGIDFFRKVLGFYKQIREDITAATLQRDGAVGGTPEVYEKINPQTGKGVVVIFSSHTGSYSYITRQTVSFQCWNTRGTSVSFEGGRAVIRAEFPGAEAKIVFFGVNAAGE
jgi:alpha-galactosidase